MMKFSKKKHANVLMDIMNIVQVLIAELVVDLYINAKPVIKTIMIK